MAPKSRVACVACRAQISSDSILCEVCGAPQKELPPCPHCRGKGGVSFDAELRLVCNLCGGPRIPHLPGDLETSGGEVGLLKKAESLRKARGFWRGGSIAAGFTLPAIALFALFLGLVWSWGVAAFVALFFGGPFAAAVAYGLRKNGERTKEIATLLDQAWVSTATDVIEAKGGKISAKDLAKMLGVDRPRAEQLLAMVSVDSELAAGTSGDRVRVTVPADERFEELEAKAQKKKRIASDADASKPDASDDPKADAKPDAADAPGETEIADDDAAAVEGEAEAAEAEADAPADEGARRKVAPT